MDSITITREQFNKTVLAANKKFMEADKSPEKDNQGLVHFMMGLQNVAFGALIGEMLFGEKEDK